MMSFLTSGILDSSQLKRLSKRKYSSHGNSILETALQPFWNWLIEKVPRSVASNTITLFGLVLNIVSVVILMSYCPTAKEEAPRWTYFCCGICLSIYQTMDILDGKQARRTKTDGLLDEYFDHGCDAISAVFIAIGASITLQLGVHPNECFFMSFVGLGVFYTAHWQAYVNGTLHFGRFDAVESQGAIAVTHFITALIGPGIWSYEIYGYRINFYLLVFSTIVSLVALHRSFKIIFSRGSSVAGTSVISPIVLLVVFLVLAIVVMQSSPTQIFQNNCCLFILTFGMVSAKITNKLIVAQMSRSPVDFADTAFIGPMMIFVNQYMGLPISNENLVLWAALIWCAADLIRYYTIICLQMAECDGMYMFDITSKPPSKSTSQ